MKTDAKLTRTSGAYGHDVHGSWSRMASEEVALYARSVTMDSSFAGKVALVTGEALVVDGGYVAR
jgi:hypothetical protein